VYRRSAVLPVILKRPGFLGVAELLGRLLLQGKTVVEHPATLDCRIFGQSKMKIARTVWGHLGLLSELAWSRLSRERPRIAVMPEGSRPASATNASSGVKL
jgi:dolichol-phosphate mannosyltransferase